MSSLRVIFAGTPDFAATSLAALIHSQHDIIAVYTQPDRPAGRGRKLHASPVKELALEHDIPVLQPQNFKDVETSNTLRDLNADIMIVAAYGLILPQAVLDTPRLGCLNIHASLLPRWRGAAPIQRAIAAGDTESGISIMQMDAGLDTGDILRLDSCEIRSDDTGGSLHDRLAEIGATAILNCLDDVIENKIKPQKQDNSAAVYAHKLNKKEAEINWSSSAEQIQQLIRAFNPWPVTYTYLNNKTLRLWSAEIVNETSTAKAGTVIRCDKKGIDVTCGEGVLRLLKLQAAGSKAMDANVFLNGHAKLVTAGTVFGRTESQSSASENE